MRYIKYFAPWIIGGGLAVGSTVLFRFDALTAFMVGVVLGVLGAMVGMWWYYSDEERRGY